MSSSDHEVDSDSSSVTLNDTSSQAGPLVAATVVLPGTDLTEFARQYIALRTRRETLLKLETSDLTLERMIVLALFTLPLACSLIALAYLHYRRCQAMWSADWQYLPYRSDEVLQVLKLYSHAEWIKCEWGVMGVFLPVVARAAHVNILSYYRDVNEKRKIVTESQTTKSCRLRLSWSYWLVWTIMVMSSLGIVSLGCNLVLIAREIHHANIALLQITVRVLKEHAPGILER